MPLSAFTSTNNLIIPDLPLPAAQAAPAASPAELSAGAQGRTSTPAPAGTTETGGNCTLSDDDDDEVSEDPGESGRTSKLEDTIAQMLTFMKVGRNFLPTIIISLMNISRISTTITLAWPHLFPRAGE